MIRVSSTDMNFIIIKVLDALTDVGKS